jgi:NRPS condensation-like uncharacterized protein
MENKCVKGRIYEPSIPVKHDAPSKFFRVGSKYFDVVNSHIFVINGLLDEHLIGQAYYATAKCFETFGLSSSSREEERLSFLDKSFRAIRTDVGISLSSADFRNFLLQHVAQRHTWTRSPIILLYIYSNQDKTSCLYLCIGHDLADIKSGCVFSNLLMQIYSDFALLETSSKHLSDCEMKFPHYPYVTLETMKPEWFSKTAMLKRRAQSNVEIFKRILTRNRTFVSPALQEYRGNTIGSNFFRRNLCDFHHSILPPDLQKAIHETAKRHGVTINTIFLAALSQYVSQYQKCHTSDANLTIAVSLRRFLEPSLSEIFRTYMVDFKIRMHRRMGHFQRLARTENQDETR